METMPLIYSQIIYEEKKTKNSEIGSEMKESKQEIKQNRRAIDCQLCRLKFCALAGRLGGHQLCSVKTFILDSLLCDMFLLFGRSGGRSTVFCALCFFCSVDRAVDRLCLSPLVCMQSINPILFFSIVQLVHITRPLDRPILYLQRCFDFLQVQGTPLNFKLRAIFSNELKNSTSKILDSLSPQSPPR